MKNKTIMGLSQSKTINRQITIHWTNEDELRNIIIAKYHYLSLIYNKDDDDTILRRMLSFDSHISKKLKFNQVVGLTNEKIVLREIIKTFNSNELLETIQILSTININYTSDDLLNNFDKFYKSDLLRLISLETTNSNLMKKTMKNLTLIEVQHRDTLREIQREGFNKLVSECNEDEIVELEKIINKL